MRRRKLSTLDFKHNSQHVAAAAAASSAQQNGMSVSAIQSQQMVTSTQSIGGNATTGQVATLLPQQPQQIKSSNGGISPTIAGNIASCVSRGRRSSIKYFDKLIRDISLLFAPITPFDKL